MLRLLVLRHQFRSVTAHMVQIRTNSRRARCAEHRAVTPCPPPPAPLCLHPPPHGRMLARTMRACVAHVHVCAQAPSHAHIHPVHFQMHSATNMCGSALKEARSKFICLRSNCTQSNSRHAASYTANRLLEMLDRNMKIKRAPERSHICAGTGPHLHRDRPTSAPGLCCCAHRAFQHRCLKGHSVP